MEYLEKDIKRLIPVVQNPLLREIGYDLETSGLDFHSDKIALIQIATPDEVYVINHRKLSEEDRRVFKYILEILEERKVLCVGHNIKFDMKFTYHNYGVMLTNVFDTMLAYTFAFAGVGRKFVSLAYLVKKYLNMILPKEERNSFIGYLGDEFTEKQIEYSAADAAILLPLKEKMHDELVKRKQIKVFNEIEMPLEPVIAFMEYTGIEFDVNLWHELAEKATKEADNIEIELRKLLSDNFKKIAKGKNALEVFEYMKIPLKPNTKGNKARLDGIVVWDDIKAEAMKELNFGSPYQVKHIVNKLGVKAKTTNAKELAMHENEHEIIPMILHIREFAKKRDGFGEDFLKHVNPFTGCIHTTLNQGGAVTGRFSSEGPNLQNIIADVLYRRAFIARKGYKLGRTDYSQIELRLIGEAAKEAKFIDAFINDDDLHTLTASLVFQVPIEEVTPYQRKIGKSMNFAVVYGSTAKGLAYNFGIPVLEAKEYLKRFFTQYGGLNNFIKMFGQKCLEYGYTVTMFGRKRYLSFPSNPTTYKEHRKLYGEKRKAVNNLPQGTSADMIKLALIYMYYDNPFGLDNFRPLLTVHDEIVVEFKEEITEQAKEFIGTCMQKAGDIFLKTIPVAYDINVADYWAKGD